MRLGRMSWVAVGIGLGRLQAAVAGGVWWGGVGRARVGAVAFVPQLQEVRGFPAVGGRRVRGFCVVRDVGPGAADGATMPGSPGWRFGLWGRGLRVWGWERDCCWGGVVGGVGTVSVFDCE